MKKLARYSKKQFGSLKMNLKAFALLPEDEYLHKIRVEIKKIKAIQRAVGASSKKFNSHKNFIRLRDIFRKAGGIRSPHIMNKLLLENQVHGLEPDELDKVPDRVEKFRKKIPEFLRKVRKSKDELDKHLRHVTGKQLKIYVSRRMKEAKAQLHPEPSFEKLHKTRKLIKEVIYLSVVLKDTDSKLIQKFMALEELAGQYHDKQTLIEALHSTKWTDKKQIELFESACNNDRMKIREVVKEIYEGTRSQLPATSDQLPVTSYQLPVTSKIP